MRFISLLLLILALEWASADQPNIILVLTDDQDIVLRGMVSMSCINMIHQETLLYTLILD